MELYTYDSIGQQVQPLNRLTSYPAFRDMHKKEIISVIGAGGKTTFINMLGRELQAQGYRVLVTTTTHMMAPAAGFIAWEKRADLRGSIDQVRKKGQLAVIGVRCADGKITSVPAADYEYLARLTDILLVEADGSRGRPLKIPAAHEPVLYPGTGITVGVAGCDSLGRMISEVTQRPEETAAWLHKSVTEQITAADIVRIIQHEQGLFCRSAGRRVLFLNKAGDQEEMRQLGRLLTARQMLFGLQMKKSDCQ